MDRWVDETLLRYMVWMQWVTDHTDHRNVFKQIIKTFSMNRESHLKSFSFFLYFDHHYFGYKIQVFLPIAI